MRKCLIVVGLTAILAVQLPGAAAAGAHPAPGPAPVCKTIFIPAEANIGLSVEKKITLAGTILKAKVNQHVIGVVKTIAVRVCVNAAVDVTAVLDLKPSVCTCPKGAYGAHINAPLHLHAGTQGGSVTVTVDVAIHDKDVIAGVAFDETKVVISEKKTIVVPPLLIEDHDALNADVCVGPVGVS